MISYFSANETEDCLLSLYKHEYITLIQTVSKLTCLSSTESGLQLRGDAPHVLLNNEASYKHNSERKVITSFFIQIFIHKNGPIYQKHVMIIVFLKSPMVS